MNKIVGQALAEKQQELLAQQRRHEFARMRTLAGSLFGGVLLLFVWFHQNELQTILSAQLGKFTKPGKSLTVSASTSSQLDQIQQGAEKRNAIISEITK